MKNIEYAGFWIRAVASVIDTLLISVILVPIMIIVYGDELVSGFTGSTGALNFILNYVLPAIVVVLFWIYRSATPGKMIVKIEIVDASTGEKLSPKQSIIRYLGYYLSMLVFFIGFFWVAFDKRKQGFHDKLAKTIVIRK